MTQRSIGRVLGARNGNKNEVVIGKKLSSTRLAAIEGFGRHKDLQILMIREDLNWVARSFEVMVPMSHRFDNGEKFAIVDIVIALCRGTLTRIKGYRVSMRIMELCHGVLRHGLWRFEVSLNCFVAS